MTTTTPIIPSIAMTISMINAYALAIADDSASDSTLDLMQFDIDCILFSDDLDLDDCPLDERDYSPIPDSAFLDAMITLSALRDFSTAAFNLRP